MKEYKNFGTVQTQNYIKEFQWNEKSYVTYLIKLEEYEGYLQINRCTDHEQALIGAKIMFNVNDDISKITKYRIVGFKETKDSRIEELMEKRKQRERNKR